MNPHFIFNTLNSLLAMVLDNKPAVAVEYISKFSKLIRYVLDEAKKNNIVLQQEIDFIRLYVELEQLRLRNRFAFNLQIADSIDPYDVYIPSMSLQPFIENAIKHGLAGKVDGNGILNISFSLNGKDCLHVCIVDNGSGREKSVPQIPARESTGISYTNERLKLAFSGKIGSDPVKITDLYNSENQPAGTQVDIDIPFIK